MNDRCRAALDQIGAVYGEPISPLVEEAEVVGFKSRVLGSFDRLGVTPEAMRARHTNFE